MDLVSGAGAFATIVGLLCNFKSERSGNDIKEFILWLKDTRHEDIADSINRNNELSENLEKLFRTSHEELLDRLNSLDKLLSSIASHVPDFSGLAVSIYPQRLISDQAVSVLKQLVDSGAKEFMEHAMSNGQPNKYYLLGGASGQIEYSEPRYLEDDLEKLVQIGLLHLKFASKGSRRFLITREAETFVNMMNS